MHIITTGKPHGSNYRFINLNLLLTRTCAIIFEFVIYSQNYPTKNFNIT